MHSQHLHQCHTVVKVGLENQGGRLQQTSDRRIRSPKYSAMLSGCSSMQEFTMNAGSMSKRNMVLHTHISLIMICKPSNKYTGSRHLAMASAWPHLKLCTQVSTSSHRAIKGGRGKTWGGMGCYLSS